AVSASLQAVFGRTSTKLGAILRPPPFRRAPGVSQRSVSNEARDFPNVIVGLCMRAARVRSARVLDFSLCRPPLEASGVPPPFILPSPRRSSRGVVHALRCRHNE